MVESEYDAAAERTEIHSQIVFVKRLVDEFCVDACQYRGRRVDGRECQSLAVGNRRIILQDFRDIIRIGRSLGRYGDGGALGLGDAAVVGDCQRNRVVARFQLDERKRLVGSGFGSFRVVRALHRPFVDGVLVEACDRRFDHEHLAAVGRISRVERHRIGESCLIDRDFERFVAFVLFENHFARFAGLGRTVLGDRDDQRSLFEFGRSPFGR